LNLKDLIEMQKDFDSKHGWSQSRTSDHAIIDAVGFDLIGLIGEVGEFANILKKVNLEKTLKNSNFEDLCSEEYFPKMREELIDAFIYLVRLMGHMDMDIESEYLDKVKYNKERFRKYEKD